jgi:hypothetical protein
MTKLQKIEQDIASLTDGEFIELAHWVAERHAVVFDARIAEDAAAGRLDEMASEALRDHEANKTRVFAG